MTLDLHITSLWRTAGGALWVACSSGTEIKGTFRNRKEKKRKPRLHLAEGRTSWETCCYC